MYEWLGEGDGLLLLGEVAVCFGQVLGGWTKFDNWLAASVRFQKPADLRVLCLLLAPL